MPYSELYVHLVWTTCERTALIGHEIEQSLWALIAAQCKKLGAIALRVGGMPDHIHLLATYAPSLALSKLMGEVKGAGSHAMTHALAPRRAFRWQDGYGAFSLRKRDVPIVERYILKQKQHHSTNQLQSELEPSNLPVPSRLQPASHA
jgi:REP element-mobilizing transposase RayT